jgi:hypothetical protein
VAKVCTDMLCVSINQPTACLLPDLKYLPKHVPTCMSHTAHLTHSIPLLCRVEKPLRSEFDYSQYNLGNIREVLGLVQGHNKATLNSLVKKSMPELVATEGWPAGGLAELR